MRLNMLGLIDSGFLVYHHSVAEIVVDRFVV